MPITFDDEPPPPQGGGAGAGAEQNFATGGTQSAGRAPAPTKVDPGGFAETAADAAVGFGTGASFDFDDEIAGAIGKLQGGDYDQARAEYQKRKELAGTRSPYAHGAAEFAGTAASTLATEGLGELAAGAAGVGKAATTGGKLLRAGGKLAGYGAVQGAGEAETLADVPGSAAKGAAVSVAAGGTLHALGAGSSKLLKGANKFAGRMEERALENDVRAAGLNPGDVAEQPGGIAGQAKAHEKMGIGKAYQGKRTVIDKANEAVEASDRARARVAADMDAADVHVEGADIAAELRAKADRLGKKAQVPGRNQMPFGENATVPDMPGAPAPKGPAGRPLGKSPAPKNRAVPADDSATVPDIANAPTKPPKGPAGRPLGDIANAPTIAAPAGPRPKPVGKQFHGPEVLQNPLVEQEQNLLYKQADYYEARGKIPFSELNRDRAVAAEKARYGEDASMAKVKQHVHLALNNALEGAAERVHPGAGRAWRAAGQDAAHAIRAREGAQGKVYGEKELGVPTSKAGAIAKVLGGAGGMLGGRGALAGAQRAAAQGARAGAPAARTMARILDRTVKPGAATAGRLAAGGATAEHFTPIERHRAQADAGIERVQAAPEEDQAKAHFLESMTNSSYRLDSLEDQETRENPDNEDELQELE